MPLANASLAAELAFEMLQSRGEAAFKAFPK